jgi:hypothetical protein
MVVGQGVEVVVVVVVVVVPGQGGVSGRPSMLQLVRVVSPVKEPQ